MKHENFKAFSLALLEYKSDAIIAFLNGGEITPRSISLVSLEDQNVLIIGYTDEVSNRKYSLETEIVGMIVGGLDTNMSRMQALALQHNGVICQSVENVGDKYVATFLIGE